MSGRLTSEPGRTRDASLEHHHARTETLTMILDRPTTRTWATALLIAGFASDFFFGCGSNVVAFAVVGAVTLGPRAGALVALGVWLESQVLGFTLFAYPHDAMTVAWGVVIGVATLLAAMVARTLAPHGRIVAFVAAFAAYEVALAAFSLATGDGLAAFSLAIVARLLATNAGIALGAFVAHRFVGFAERAIGVTDRARRA